LTEDFLSGNTRLRSIVQFLGTPLRDFNPLVRGIGGLFYSSRLSMSFWANTARDFVGRPSSSRAISPKSVLMAGLPEWLTIDGVVADAFTLLPHYIHALTIWQPGSLTVPKRHAINNVVN
jgi:hypothetical protein